MSEFALLIIAFAINLIIALFVLLRNTSSITHRLFFIFTITLALFSINNFISLEQDNNILFSQIVWIRLDLFIGAFMMLFGYLVIEVFPHSQFQQKSKSRRLIVIYSVAVALLALTPFIFPKVVIGGDGFAKPIPTPLIAFYTLQNIGLLAGIIVVALKRHKTAARLLRQQLTIVGSGIVAVLSIIIFANLIMVNVFQNTNLILASSFSVIIFTSAFTYTIIRHRLLEIRLIVARSVGYVLVLGFFAGIYTSIIFIATNFLVTEAAGNRNQQIVLTLVAVGMAIAFQPLKEVIDRLTNKIFFRDAYDTQEFLDHFNKEIVTTIELENLIIKASKIIKEYLWSEFVVFVVPDKNGENLRILNNNTKAVSDKIADSTMGYLKKQHEQVIVADNLEGVLEDLRLLLREANTSLVVKITSKHETGGIGYIFMGPKKTGSSYNSQDTKALKIIGNELSIAIENALRYEEIQQFNVTLQDKVDDATKKLRDANERLKQLDQTKDDFISMASHQLRTPLTSAKGYLSMVIEGDAGKITNKQKDLLDQAFLSSQRMVYLIADLLNVSRLRTGKFVIESKPTNLAEVIEGEIKQLEQTAKAKDQKLTFNKPKSFPTLMFDETKMRQVIMNFADNAVHYVPNGGKIDISLEDLGDSIEFKVVDTGIGVPKAEQHHLFSKFYRANNAKKARPDGTGLGLFMAKKVVAAQGGAIIFNSTEGKGSTFGFTFAKKKVDPSNYKPDLKH